MMNEERYVWKVHGLFQNVISSAAVRISGLQGEILVRQASTSCYEAGML
jgi:hypothetical protein